MTEVLPQTAQALRSKQVRPPLPREHGAWVILYAPLLVGFGVAGGFHPLAWLALTGAITGVFLAREAASLLLRRRSNHRTAFWLTLYLGLALLGALPLFTTYRAISLLPIGLIMLTLFGIHSLLLVTPARKRLDRTEWGEALGVAALTLTAPAAYGVGRGRLDAVAWLIWLACTLYFVGGVLYIKMWLKSAVSRIDWQPQFRYHYGTVNLAYHTVLALVVFSLCVRIGGAFALYLAVGIMPTLVRAFYGWQTLTNKLPPLKRAGMMEALRALWFAGFFIAAMRAL